MTTTRPTDGPPVPGDLSRTDVPEASAVWKPALPPVSSGGLARPRVGIAGIAIESSTFSPHVTGREDFVVRRGDTLRDYYGFLGEGSDLGGAAQWIPLTQARSLPGGPVDPAVYAELREEIVDAIRRERPFDGFYLDIHGAMSVVGMRDADADLACAIREALGEDTLVSASMDLHGNVSRELLDAVDLITCYRMAPHEDEKNTKHRAVHNLLRRLRASTGRDPHGRRPLKAWVQVPVLLPGEKTSTRIEPARSIYAEVANAEAQPGVLDAAVWVGYAWADEPRCQAAVVVTGDDAEGIRAEARRLAELYWSARDDFEFVAEALPLSEALDQALARRRPTRPFVISDSGDNPTAGGAGDVTWTLARLLERREFSDGATVLHASVFDREAVASAAAAGVGASVTVRLGAQVDSRSEGPVRFTAEVVAVVDGDPVAGRQVVLRRGGVHAIITERRKPFHLRSDFVRLGQDPEDFDIVVVKIGYLEPELFELARGWILGLTPGGVDQDLLRLGHHNLATGVFPFCLDHDPDLEPVVSSRSFPTVNS